MPLVKTIMGNALPERVSFSKGHGATPTTCEAQYSGVVEIAWGTIVSYQVSGSLWTGKVASVLTRKNDSAGLMTIIRAIDLRDALFDGVVFGRINMIDHDTGAIYTVLDNGTDWNIQRETTEYIYPRALIEGLLSLCNFSAEYSPEAERILASTAGSSWMTSRYNVFNLDWNTGTKVGAALTQICDALGIQFCMSTYLSGRVLRFSKIGEQEYNIEFQGVAAAEGTCGDAVQQDADTGVWIVGDRDVWEFQDLPQVPAWNQKWNEIFWSAAARQAFEAELDAAGESVETIHVGDIVDVLGDGYTDYLETGFLDGRFFNDMILSEYLEKVPFHVYRIPGMNNFMSPDEFDGTVPVRCAPIQYPLISDPALQYSIKCAVISKHTKKHKQAIKVSLEKHLKEHGHHLSDKTGHVVFDEPQFVLKGSATDKINPSWDDYEPDTPQITVCFKGKMYREFFGTDERVGTRTVQGLCRHMLVTDALVPNLNLTPEDYEETLDGVKYAYDFASDIATSILEKPRVVRSGEETFIGIAGHEPSGEISRVSVEVDSMQGIKETVNYANDEPSPLYDPQVELRRKILVDQQLRALVKVRDDKKIESLRKLRTQCKALASGTQKDHETMAALEAFNRGNFMEVINTEEFSYIAGEPLVAEPNDDGEFATLTDADISDGDKRIAGIVLHGSDADRLRVCTAGIANARVTGPVENGDSLVLDNSTANYALKKGDGGPMVALQPVASGTTSVVPVRIGGGGAGVSQMKVVSISDDYLVCNTWDGTTQGTDAVKIAKPWQLRRTPFDGKTYNGITYTYSTAVTRSATDGTNTETQVIVPAYVVGDVIYTAGVAGLLADETVKALDVNVDGRAWAKQ